MNRDELKALIREVLSEMLAPVLGSNQPAPSERWIDLQSAWEQLGYPSYNALYKDVQFGLFREGKELCDRRKPGAKLARWQIDIIAARKRLRENPAKRRSV